MRRDPDQHTVHLDLSTLDEISNVINMDTQKMITFPLPYVPDEMTR